MSSIPPGVPSFSPADLDPDDEPGHVRGGGHNATIVRSAPQEVMDALRSHAPATVPPHASVPPSVIAAAQATTPPPASEPSPSGLRTATPSFDFSKGPVLLSDEDEAEMLADATKLAPRPGQRAHEAAAKPPPPHSIGRVLASASDVAVQESGDVPTFAEVPPLDASVPKTLGSAALSSATTAALAAQVSSTPPPASHSHALAAASERGVHEAVGILAAGASRRNRLIGALVVVALIGASLLAFALNVARHR